MSDVISLQKHRKLLRQKQGKKSTFCGNGFHSWEVVTSNQFDVKLGKLVTAYRCTRCGINKVEAR